MQNYAESFIEHVSSGAGTLWPVGMLMAIFSAVASESDLERVWSNLLAALAFIPIGWVTAYFIADKEIKNRWFRSFQVYLLIYFAYRCYVHIWVVITFFSHAAHIPASVSNGSTVTEVGLGVVCLILRTRLSRTYRADPEAAVRELALQQEIIKSLRNSAQIAVQVDHLAGKRVEQSENLAELIQNVGRT